MARLSDQQVLELIKKPVNSSFIMQARDQEGKLVMHTEPILREWDLPSCAWGDFLYWVKQMLPPSKFVRFKQLLTFPLDTIESTETIFDELRQVFNAQDSYISFDFVSSEFQDDYLKYLEDMKDADFWITKAFAALQNGINSILIVDLPASQPTDVFRPEPYYYLLNINRVIDILFNDLRGNVEYIIFDDGDNRAICLDDDFYRVLVKNPVNGEWIISSASKHELGYCPAEPLYKKAIINTRQINKRAPLTKAIGKLNWLLFFRTAKRYLDLYAAWPILASYDVACSYTDAEGNRCMDGKVTHNAPNPVDGDERAFIEVTENCPLCKERELLGPGSEFTMPAPRSKDGFDMMDNPAKFIEASNDKLEYCVSEIQRLEDEIYLSAVGYDGDALNKNAVNETQVASNFESKEAVLDSIKTELQRAQKFVIDTMARLRYGKYFVKSTVDWGSEYFLSTVDDITRHMSDAQKNGMPNYYINTLQQRIIQTKSKGNPDQQKRDYILSQLEPWPGMAQTVVLGMKYENTEDYIIKTNFTTFIQRFEREQTNIVEFANKIDFNIKINLINQKLKQYATEYKGADSSAWIDPQRTQPGA